MELIENCRIGCGLTEEKGGRRSLSEILRLTKAGRACTEGYVAKTVANYLAQQVRTIYSPILIDADEVMDEVAPIFGITRDMTVAEMLLMKLGAVMDKEQLSWLSFSAVGDLMAFNAYRRRRPRPEKTESSDSNSQPSGNRDDSVFRQTVLPFLRLSVIDYFQYLANLPEPEEQYGCDCVQMDFREAYRVCFFYDVYLWKQKYGKDPTISEVLMRCWETLILNDNCSHKLYPDSRGFIRWDPSVAEPIPFQVSASWPPTDREIRYAMNWVNLLLVYGPMRVVVTTESTGIARQRIADVCEKRQGSPMPRG